MTKEVEKTPEMLAAVDQGIASLQRYGGIPIEVVKARLKEKWESKVK